MKVIVAGSRSVTDYATVADAIQASGFAVEEVVSGTARGVDRLGEMWANYRRIPLKKFPANWDAYGRAAGVIRSNEMAIYADALIAVWDGKSRGTAHMIETAEKNGLEIFVKRVEP